MAPLRKVIPADEFARYRKATTDMKHRIVAHSAGEIGSGKTRFWLTAPGPIVIQSMDQGLEGVVEPYLLSLDTPKDIHIADYDIIGAPGSDGYTHELAEAARDKFVADFEHAITAKARTIVWDRDPEIWDMFYYAEFGTDDAFAAAPPKDWDKLKGKIRRLIAMAKASDVNFGIIAGLKNEWGKTTNPRTGAKAASQTGNRVVTGMEGVDGLVHTTLFHERHGKDFSITVGKSRGPGGYEIQDQTLENVTFPEFAMLVFPDSDESEWV